MISTQDECCDKGIDKGHPQQAAGEDPAGGGKGCGERGLWEPPAGAGSDRSLQGGGVTGMGKDT